MLQVDGAALTFVLRLVDAELSLGDPAHHELGPDPEADAEEDVRGDLRRWTAEEVRGGAAGSAQRDDAARLQVRPLTASI